MTPTERGQLQSAILDSIRAAAPDGRPSNTAIGNVLGCDRSELSRFAAGTRRMDLDELHAAAEVFGVDAVLGPIAAAFGRTLAPADAPATLRELPRASARVTVAAAALASTVTDLLSDGDCSEEDAEAIQALVTALAAATHKVAGRRVMPGRVA
jgi:hypothetical protein